MEIMQLSEISLYEYVTINATWHYANNERQFNCKKQLAKYQKHSETQVEDFLNKNGCQDRIIETIRHQVNNINFYSIEKFFFFFFNLRILNIWLFNTSL